MQFTDRLTIDRKHRSSDGYLRVHAKAARSGIQDYLGREVDPEGKHFAADAVVKVYRPAEEVFAKASMASFIGKPITDDHPTEAVTAANWRDHSRGVIGGAAKDGEWLGFDLALMDATTIQKVDNGKCELSGGYGCDLSIEDGKTLAGEAYQAVQRNIRGNHVALVDRARAGSNARISDGGNKLFENCDAATVILADGHEEKPVKTMLIDGLTVDMANADTAIATATTLRDARDAATKKLVELDGTVTARDAMIVAKDAEIVKLTSDIAAAKLTPAQLRDAGKAYAVTVAKAQASGVTVTDEMDEAAIMKAVVDKAMPSNTYTADHVAIAFDALTKDVKTDGGSTLVQPIHMPMVANDTASVLAAARAARRQ